MGNKEYTRNKVVRLLGTQALNALNYTLRDTNYPLTDYLMLVD